MTTHVTARVVYRLPLHNDWDAIVGSKDIVERYFETADCASKIAERLNIDDEENGGDGNYRAQQFINGIWRDYYRPLPVTPVDLGDDYIPF